MPRDASIKGKRPPGAERHGVRARKRFGQHFLTDKNLLAKIVRVAGVEPGEHVLEVGPGTGSLTASLIEAGALVTAIEVDRRLARALEKRFSRTPGFTLLQEDVLKVSFTEFFDRYRTPLKLVSNLPYNITAPVLFKLLDERRAFSRIVIMLQKEVADRLVSGPGTKEYGAITVLLGLHFDVRKEFNVSRKLFIPRPGVDSAVLSFVPLPAPRVRVEDEQFFTRVVKAAFSTRRKMLVNALTSLGLKKSSVIEALEEAGVAPEVRAETLALAEFSAIAASLGKVWQQGEDPS